MTARRQAGEGGIFAYQTKSGTRYRIHWREPADPDQPNGPRRQRTRNGFNDKKSAAGEPRTILASQDTGRYVQATDVTVREYADTWLVTKRLAPSTAAMHRRYLRLHVVPHLGRLSQTDGVRSRSESAMRGISTREWRSSSWGSARPSRASSSPPHSSVPPSCERASSTSWELSSVRAVHRSTPSLSADRTGARDEQPAPDRPRRVQPGRAA